MKFDTAVASLALASATSATLQITSPNSSVWWVANSTNFFSWTCESSPAQKFTVLIDNKDRNILGAPKPFIAIMQNSECSRRVTPQQAIKTPATGYTLYLVNPLNNTEIYARSEEFEIKPYDSSYPTQVVNSPSGEASDSGSGALGSDAPYLLVVQPQPQN